MEMQTFQYEKGTGWSVPQLPDLDSENTLVLIFAAPSFIDDPAPVQELVKKYPKSKVMGCSSAGEIFGPYILDNSLSVAVVRFESTQLMLACVSARPSSYQAGEEIFNILNRDNLKGILVLSDGLVVNGTELVRGLNANKKEDTVITGGLAADGKSFKKTWSICGEKILVDHVVAIGFYGHKIRIGHASRGGWDIFGPQRRITLSEGNILYELDDQPALKLYKEYLGDLAAGLPATGLLFPLAISKDMSDERQLVRTILGVNEEKQSLTFAGDVPVGYLAQLMRANLDRLIMSASEAGGAALLSMLNTKPGVPVLAVAISCVGRRLVLGEKTEEETESTYVALPEGSQQIGFYSYGELSPFTSGACDLHNQTMTLTLFCEDK